MCTGAHLALAMARQLEAAGAETGFLGIVNTWGLNTVSRRYYLHRAINVGHYYARRLRAIVRPAELPEDSPRSGLAQDGTAGAAGAADPWIGEVGWTRGGEPAEKIRAKVTVFRIRKQPYWRIRDAGLGWGAAAEEVSVVMLPGDDHNAMLREPRVRELAGRVQECLDERPEFKLTPAMQASA